MIYSSFFFNQKLSLKVNYDWDHSTEYPLTSSTYPHSSACPETVLFKHTRGLGYPPILSRVTVNNSAMEEGTLFLTNFWLFQDTLGIIITYYILLNKKLLYYPVSNALVGPCMSSVFSRVWLFATPCSAPGSSIHAIIQARILEWVAISYSKGSSRPRDLICAPRVSCIGRRILYHRTTWEEP